MNSEKQSSGPKPEARQPSKGRNAARPEGDKSSSPVAERQPRRRDGGEPREGGERRERPDRQERGERQDRPNRPDRPDRPNRLNRPDRPDRPERSDRPDRPERQDRPDRPERQERQERPERPRRPQGGQGGGAERNRPAGEDKSHRPVVHVKGDIAAGSTWAKGGSGPSFADMVRQRANAAAEKQPAKETPPPAKPATPTPPPETPQQETPQQAPQQAPSQPTPPPQTPPQQQQQQQQQPEESSEEEEVVVMTAAPVVEVEPIPEPPVPVPPVIPPHYVLEIERVVSVKLPPRVTQMAETQRGAYMFSAQAGKPPTPPPTVPQPAVHAHAVYRPDTANLGARQWSLGTDSRIQQPPQQQAWPSASQIDYWNSSADRAPASRPFMGSQPQAPYNSYPTAVPLPHQRPASSAFPMRFRSSEVPEAVLRQQPSAPFNRSSQATNGGGVW